MRIHDRGVHEAQLCEMVNAVGSEIEASLYRGLDITRQLGRCIGGVQCCESRKVGDGVWFDSECMTGPQRIQRSRRSAVS